MDCYEVWCNLRSGVVDLEFVAAVQAYLGQLQSEGRITSFRIRRRKFGFGPEALGEWNITMEFENLTQLDSAFQRVATRDADIEGLHAAVYGVVTDFKSGLYRDFPDSVRISTERK